MIQEILILLATLLIFLFFYYKKRFAYWSKKGVKSLDTKTILKYTLKLFTQDIAFSDFTCEVYNKFPGTRYTGYFDLTNQILIIKDPELIKQVTVKDFDHFVNHLPFIPEDSDPLWNKNLFALSDQKWREMRSMLSPAFTSSKMRYLFGLIKKNGERFSQYFINQGKDLQEVELKDAFTRFTNDVIASSAFGIEIDSLKDRNNDFYRLGRKILSPDFITNLKFILYSIIPSIKRIIKISFFSDEISSFFNKIVSDNIKTREAKSIVRPDLINLLMEARKNGLKYEETAKDENEGFATAQESEIGKLDKIKKIPLSDEDITAQAMIFFFAGFDSVSSLMCFMAYELGLNREIQERLIREIDEADKSCNGELTYDVLQSMKYLDMIMSETLRKWPNTALIDRLCNKTYIIEPKLDGEVPITIDKGMDLWIPIHGIHRDPNYYPDPEKFDPERFSDENKHKIQPYSYLPFGAGPRNCIGSRFALLETKALFFYLLKSFEIVPTEKTKVPLEMNPKSFNLDAKGGFWLGLKRRQK